MAKHERYSAYKDSASPWFGRIPSRWELKPLKYLASINDEKLADSTDGDEVIEYVDIGNVTLQQGICGSETLSFEKAPSRARRIVRDGDSIVSTVRTYLKAIAPIKQPPPNLIVSTGFAVIRPRALDPGYLSYHLQSSNFVEDVVSRSVGVSYPAINPTEIAEIELLQPPLEEQQTIAAWLDERTARIDTLIAKKQRLIELLQENRQAIISKAVTRGLDPHVKLKDSGIPWLGEVPEHWEVQSLKHTISSITQGWSPQCENFPAEPDEWGVLKAGCVNGTTLNEQENKRLPDELTPDLALEVKAGDILMSRANTTELVGSCVFVTSVRPKLILCDKLYRFLPISGYSNGQYLVNYLQSHAGREYIQQNASGASNSMQNIGQDVVREAPIALPPILEQQLIVEYIESNTRRIDEVRRRVAQAIQSLTDYRAALITAAVSGQIKV